MHNVNYEINATSKSRDLVDFFLFLWGRENPERGKDTFLLKIPIPHANWGQTHNSLQKPNYKLDTKQRSKFAWVWSVLDSCHACC